MARVFFPPSTRTLTGGQQSIEVEGATVLEVIQQVDRHYPGFKDRMCVNDALRPGVMVVVDSSASSLGTLQRVSSASEIHFLPAIGGG